MKKASFLGFILFLFVCCLPVFAGDLGQDAGIPGVMTTGTPAYVPAASTPELTPAQISSAYRSATRIPVQQVAIRRPLTSADYAGVESFIRHWCLKGKRAEEIRREYLELLAMDIYHLPVYLKRTPAAVYADYQVYTQSINRVEKYVNVPSLPAFQACPSVGGVLSAPTLATDFQGEQMQTYVATQPTGGAHRFGTLGETHEVPVGSVNYSWYDVDQKRRYFKPLPPPIPPPPGCGPFPGGPGNIPGPGVPY